MALLLSNKQRLAPGRQRRRFPLETVLLNTALTIAALIYLYPFLWMIASSLKSENGFFNGGLSLVPDQWLWSNYARAWTDANFGQYFGNTLFVTVISVIGSVLFSSMAGFALGRLRMIGKRVVFGVIAVLFFLPSGYAIIVQFDLIQSLGFNNSLWAIIILNVSGGLIVNSILFSGYFSTMSREVEEAAIVDGAGVFQRYWRICMPLAKPMIATVSLFGFIGSWNNFLVPLIFTLGNPDQQTLGVGMLSFVGEHSRDWTLTCAAAVISLIPIAILFFFLQRYFIEGLSGAVK